MITKTVTVVFSVLALWCAATISEEDWDYMLDLNAVSSFSGVGPITVAGFQDVTVCWWLLGVHFWLSDATLFSLANGQSTSALNFGFYRNSSSTITVLGTQRMANLSVGLRLLNDDQWNHVCVTWRSTDGAWAIHVDGSKHAEDFGLHTGASIQSGSLAVGLYQQAIGGNYDIERLYRGTISHFNMWDSVLSEGRLKRMSLTCGAETGNLLPWFELKLYKRSLTEVISPASCKAKEKHRLDFSDMGEDPSDQGFSDFFSWRKADVNGGAGAEADMKVLSIQGDATLKFPTPLDECINEPSVCVSGFTMSFLLKHKPTFISHILGGNSPYQDALDSWLSEVTPNGSRWTRCYRAVNDGFSAAMFHSKCDNRGPTVTLVKVEEYIFGGFLDQVWGGDDRQLTSNSAFVFSLNNRDNLGPIKLPINISDSARLPAAHSFPGEGPIFGFEDIFIGDGSNEELRSRSDLGQAYELPSGYAPYTPEARNLLAGSYWFIPDDIEVFSYEAPHVSAGVSDPSVISDEQLIAMGTASLPYRAPPYARLNTLKTWCSYYQRVGEWIQVDLGVSTVISAIAVHGMLTGDAYVQTFLMEGGLDGITWTQHPVILQGPPRSNETVTRTVQPSLTARYVRLLPQTWHRSMSMSFELYTADGSAVGIEDPSVIPNDRFSASSSIALTLPRFGRLKYRGAYHSAWMSTMQGETWLQVDLGKVGLIGFVATQGSNRRNSATASYYLAYSLDNATWTDYEEIGIKKLFHGNWDNPTVVKNAILSPFLARFIRFIPVDCLSEGCFLRIEVYFLITETKTNILSSAADRSNSATGLAFYETSNGNSSTYEARVTTLTGLLWSLSFDAPRKSQEWVQLTITWHTAWGLKVYRNGIIVNETNTSELVPVRVVVIATHLNIGGIESSTPNAISLGVNLQMSDLRIWERFASRQEILGNYEVSVNTDKGIWYMTSNGEFQAEVDSQDFLWQQTFRCTKTASTGPCNDGSSAFYPSFCSSAIGLESGLIRNGAFASSSPRSSSFQAHNARLNSASCWSANAATSSPWIEVRMPRSIKITRIATQGSADQGEWVEEYNVTYSSGSTMYTYPGTFQANFDRSTVVSNYLSVTTLKIRIYPTKWHGHASLRLELYGCEKNSFMYMESSYPRVSGDFTRLLSPFVTESHTCLSFSYFMLGSTIGRLNVLKRDYDGQESLLWRLAGRNLNSWETAKVPIASRHPYQVVFEGVVGNGYLGDIGLIKVSFSVTSNCDFQPLDAKQQMSGVRSQMIENGPMYQDKLKEWLDEEGFGNKYWVPCYRASLEGWNETLLRQQCGDKEATVTIIRKDNCLFGGFSDKSWTASGSAYSTVGCFQDQNSRAIATLESKDPTLDGSYQSRANAIEKCYQAAKKRGFKVFAVQNGGWCAASGTAEQTFDKYGPSSACNADGKGGPLANQVYVLIGWSRGYIPNTKAFLFTLQSPFVESVQKKWSLKPDFRHRAVKRGSEGLQFGDDLLIQPTDRSVLVGIGNTYDSQNDEQFNELLCQANGTVIQASDVEVLFPMDTMCDPPCLHNQYCDEVSGHCVCNETKRDEGRCLERAELQASRDEYCNSLSFPGELHARFDVSLTSNEKMWRCYEEEALTKDRARFNGNSSSYYTRDSELRAMLSNYPLLKLESLLLKAEYHLTMDHPDDVLTSVNNTLSWTSGLMGKTKGVKDGAVFTNGDTSTMSLFNSTSCLSSPDLCPIGFTLALWLKHTRQQSGQTFLSSVDTDDSLGLRVFQLNGSFDHVAVELRLSSKRCLWAFAAPQNIWSHFVFAFDSAIAVGSCGSLRFFLNGERRSPVLFTQTARSHPVASRGVKIGDSARGLPIATYDELIVWNETFNDTDILQVFNYYKAQQYRVDLDMRSSLKFNSKLLDPEYFLTIRWDNEFNSRALVLFGSSNVEAVEKPKYTEEISGNQNCDVHLNIVFKQTTGQALDKLQFNRELLYQSELLAVDGLDVDVHGLRLYSRNKTSLTSVNITWDSVNITWDSPPDTVNGIFHGYKLFHKETNEPVLRNETISTTQTSFLITGLVPWTLYTVYIRVVTLNGAGKKSDDLFVWTKPIAPTYVTVNSSRIDAHVGWKPISSSHVSQYLVICSPTTDNLGVARNVTVSASPSPLAICSNLTAFVNYSVRVAGIADEVGPTSEPVYIVPERDDPTDAPTNVTVQPRGTSVLVTWSGITFPYLSGYYVFCFEIKPWAPEMSMQINGTTNDTFAYVTGLTHSTPYTLQVAAIGRAEALGPRSLPVNFATLEAPDPPSNITIFSTSASTVRVCWETPPSTVDHYVLRYSAAHDTVEIPEVRKQNVTVSGLQPSTAYQVEVAGSRLGVQGPFSDPVTVVSGDTESAKPPPNFTAFSSGNTEILTCWNESVSQLAVGYRVFFTRLDNWSSIEHTVSLDLDELNYSLTNRTFLSNYTVQISLITKCGPGIKSEPVVIQVGTEDPGKKLLDVKAFSTSNNSLGVQWSRNLHSLVTGYLVECKETGVGLIRSFTVDSLTSYVDIEGLTTSTQYIVQLSSVTRCHFGIKSDPQFVVTAVLHPPSNVKSNATGLFTMYLEWQPVVFEELEGYTVLYRKQSHNGTDNSASFDSTNVNSSTAFAQIGGLKPETTYQFQVRVFSFARTGPPSVAILGTTFKATVENLAAEAISPVDILAQWTAFPSEDLLGYIVMYRNINTTNAYLNVTVQANMTYVEVTDLAPSSNYSIQVVVRVRGYQGRPSDPTFAVTEDLLTISPQELQGTSGINNITLQWQVINFEPLKGYVIFYRLADNASDAERVLFMACNDSFVLFELEPSTNYSVQVAGFTGYQVGPRSEPLFVKTDRQPLHIAPSSLTAYAWSTTSIYVSWAPVPFETLRGYVVFYSRLTSSSRRKRSVSNSSNELNVTLTSARAGSTFLVGLAEYVNYSIQVSGYSDFEVGPRTNTTYILTDETVPRGPPSRVRVSSIDSTTIEICWSEIPNFSSLEGFEVSYVELGQNSTQNKSTDAATYSATLVGLSGDKTYSVQVAGKADGQLGPFSSALNIQPTNYSAPEPIAFPGENTTIFVCWNYRPTALSFRVEYHDVNLNRSLAERASVNLANNFVELKDLTAFTNYGIQLVGVSRCGSKKKSKRVYSVAGERGPLAPPHNITANASSPSSVRVTWLANPHPLVEGYVITCKEENSSEVQTTHVTAANLSNLTVVFDGLVPFVNYSVQVRTWTWCQNGSWSDAVQVSTGEGVPSHPPINVTAWAQSFSSIYVSWSPVPRQYQNGIILGYRVTYWEPGNKTETNKTLTCAEENIEIHGLHKGWPYYVIVSAFTSVGDGNFSNPLEVWTEEDVPSLPPQDLTAENHTTLDSIPVVWRPIPIRSVHGFLRHYRVRYEAVMLAGERITGGEVKEKLVPPGNLATVLDDLDRYTVYKIDIWGATSKGGGPIATTFAETCYCHKRMTTNWMVFPPYVDQSSTNGSQAGIPIGGIIPPVVVGMVSECCGSCKSHGKSYVDFSADGHGVLQPREDYNTMISNITQETDISFPVFGKKGQTEYKNEFAYLQVVHSPGVAHIINTRDEKRDYSIVYAIRNLWPVLMVTFVLVYISGVVIWTMERNENAEQFKPPFIRGSGEGMWWSFISATTLGYGDRAPVTYSGRLFSVFWILTGLVLIGILTGSITTAITTIIISADFKVYGEKVSVVQDSPEYKLGLRKSALMENATFQSFRDVFKALDSGEVKHALFDTYAMGSEKALFEDKPHLRVFEIFDYESTYGLVIGGESKILRKCFEEYETKNLETIFKTIEDNIDSIRPPEEPLIVELSTGMFDKDSPVFKSLLKYCLFAIAACLVLGVVWEARYRIGQKNKVETNDLDDQVESFKELRQMLEDLHLRMLSIAAGLKAKHIKELNRLRRLREANGLDVGERQEIKDKENDEPKIRDRSAFDRTLPPLKRTSATSYALSSNPENDKIEYYFLNLR